ncbi:proton channel OtopLc-like [Bombus affinis]|uniref:Proton channel OtopLc n=1 Tax=Bombus terrestris TaxID=30195 RepID=A0A9C6WBT2_BOMTE|nr:proton channel OtopLc [Bombus terrestris]XP_012174877.1 proton channel OtopLc [Bombus terrestris]XP_048270408.1 proton channel OtopLc [Bombus terrestris]XP_048270409.1 proton channel OtopLc [Bombus terrestris]XP_048270410.1 proton channel OtopLc [Bombus terrestris]XP_050583546.1 proton channel OtopLc-like [Bombus affinis]XP_050583547.1 proton channel OtopLc-like [Bombus affinis]XP_050583548.1 proton channel OtopLc-like [Bombus affinis]
MNNSQSNITTTCELKTRDAPTAITLSSEADGKEYLFSPRGRMSHPRGQNMSLTAVINHRRGLLGALISGLGSNMSLPSCIPQDQEFVTGHTTGCKIPLLNNRNHPERNDHERQRPNFLPLSPVNTAYVSVNALEPAKVKQQMIEQRPKLTEKRKCHAEMVSIMSTLYANLLIVVGLAVPITANVTERVPASLNQGFYLYLYVVSVTFVISMYVMVLRDKAEKNMVRKNEKEETLKFDEKGDRVNACQTQQYGSFCLRLGAVGFGAGSLVFTGLQIGAEIASGPFRAITPGARLLLVTAQMHFIFLNSKSLNLAKHAALAKLGLMHMIATNLCEWLQALVEETQHEIDQLGYTHDDDDGILKSLLRDASPFLFPCTIEFSLICAVILFEMWKRVDEKIDAKSEIPTRSSYHLSIDCSSSHKGLFGGILVVAATILSLIMFFVLKEAKMKIAIVQVTSLDATILMLGMIASVAGTLKLQALQQKIIKPSDLDTTLLAAAQAGVYLHCLFGVVGDILTMGPTWILSLITDLLALLQSTSQTLLIKNAWGRRCSRNDKPGKELITFLIVVNIALWTVNTLEKSRAGVRPDHLRFFGVWAWTIITHVSMPLAIFYRFHSAICLFEIWKTCYKCRSNSVVQSPY